MGTAEEDPQQSVTLVLRDVELMLGLMADHEAAFRLLADREKHRALRIAALTLASVPEAEIRERLGLSAEEFEKANARLRRALGHDLEPLADPD